MSEENKYDHDSVQELLTWAKETLSNKSYPDGKFQINKATTVLDCASFLSSMIQMISRNWRILHFILLSTSCGNLGRK